MDTDLSAWERLYGTNPDDWPKPSGQPLTWNEWACALHLEALQRGWDLVLWRPEITGEDVGRSYWAEEWLAGKSPAQTADEHHDSQILPPYPVSDDENLPL